MDLNAEQKRIATQEPKGHMLLRGVAGSGKTSVGIYRVSFLHLNYCFGKDDAILLATYNRTLIHYMSYLYEKMDKIKNAEFSSLFEAPDRKVDIQTVDSLMFKYYQAFAAQKKLNYKLSVPQALGYEIINEGISKLKKQYPKVAILNQKNMAFLNQEISWIKDCLYLDEEAYQSADRKGMSRSQADSQPQRLPKNSDTRKAIFELKRFYDREVHQKGHISFGDMRLMALKQARKAQMQKYTHAIIDESQDLTRSQLLFLKYIYNEKDYSSICFIADTAQNIYPQSWIGSGQSFASIGFSMQGRSYSLSKNFRTTTQISQAAYSLIEDCTDIVEDDNFVKPSLIDKQGKYPICKEFDGESKQAEFLVQEILKLKDKYSMGDIAIIGRFKRQLNFIQEKLKNNGIACAYFSDKEDEFESKSIKLVTMHSIKGLEFPLVFIIGLNDDVMPFFTEHDSGAKYEEEIKERKLLYVGMTRATETLYLLSSSRPSRFISDISSKYLRTNRSSRLSRFYNISIEKYRYKDKLMDMHVAEEKIRQWMIAELLDTYGYPLDCILVEFPVKYFSKKGYVDIAIQIKKEETTIPLIFIETKRRGHDIRDALDQVKSYMSNCRVCEYGAATDGQEFVVIDKNFKVREDLPVFKNSWGLSNAIRFEYLNLRTNIVTNFCCDPNQPDSIEIDLDGDCEYIENDQLEKIPVYGKIAAGQPIAMNTELDQDIYLPKKWVRGGSYFILKITGDSMNGAKINNNDLVLVRSQPSADNLDIAVVGLDEEGTLKRFSRMGSNIILLSENPKYDPIMLDDDQVNVLGVAVGVIKKSQ